VNSEILLVSFRFTVPSLSCLFIFSSYSIFVQMSSFLSRPSCKTWTVGCNSISVDLADKQVGFTASQLELEWDQKIPANFQRFSTFNLELRLFSNFQFKHTKIGLGLGLGYKSSPLHYQIDVVVCRMPPAPLRQSWYSESRCNYSSRVSYHPPNKHLRNLS
jgi:hypothetical protein